MRNRDRLVVFGMLVLVLAVVLLIPAIFPRANGQGGAKDPATSAASASMPAPQGNRYRGMWLQVSNNDPDIPYEQYVREIAATGANMLCLSISAVQENGSSSVIFLDSRRMPSDERLAGLIALGKSLKMRVALMPIVLLERGRAGEWRGKISPEDWTTWWDYYTQYVVQYANLAQRCGVDLYLVGSELATTDQYEDKWRAVITRVREAADYTIRVQFAQFLKEKFPSAAPADYAKEFGTPDLLQAYSQPAERRTAQLAKAREEFAADHRPMLLSYSSNWDHYMVCQFWDALDVVGMTTYYDLNSSKAADPTLESLVEAWKPIRRDILAWQEKVRKPIIFTEVGWASQDGCSIEPWNYYHSETPDMVEQQRCMESFLKTFGQEPWVGGVLVWKWRDYPGSVGGEKDYSYVPTGKPVLKTIEAYFAAQTLADKVEAAKQAQSAPAAAAASPAGPEADSVR